MSSRNDQEFNMDDSDDNELGIVNDNASFLGVVSYKRLPNHIVHFELGLFGTTLFVIILIILFEMQSTGECPGEEFKLKYPNKAFTASCYKLGQGTECTISKKIDHDKWGTSDDEKCQGVQFLCQDGEIMACGSPEEPWSPKSTEPAQAGPKGAQMEFDTKANVKDMLSPSNTLAKKSKSI